MAEAEDPKTTQHRYLQAARDALVWKLDGLSEREARRPRTPTGNNLLGLLKHCLNVEAGYFGPTFGREFPTPHELVPDEALERDPQADWYATADETKDGLIDLARRVWAFADTTIFELPLDAPGPGAVVAGGAPGRHPAAGHGPCGLRPRPPCRPGRHSARVARRGHRLSTGKHQHRRRLRLAGVRRQADCAGRSIPFALRPMEKVDDRCVSTRWARTGTANRAARPRP